MSGENENGVNSIIRSYNDRSKNGSVEFESLTSKLYMEKVDDWNS